MGLRRIRFVRIAIGDGVLRCEAVGTGHRLPATRPIPIRSATALVRAGVPLVVRRTGGAAAVEAGAVAGQATAGAGRKA